MDATQFIILLTNKLNALNSALGSAIQSGSIDAIEQLKIEIVNVETELSQVKLAQ